MKIIDFVLDTMIAYFCAVMLLIPIANVFYLRILRGYWLENLSLKEQLRKKSVRVKK